MAGAPRKARRWAGPRLATLLLGRSAMKGSKGLVLSACAVLVGCNADGNAAAPAPSASAVTVASAPVASAESSAKALPSGVPVAATLAPADVAKVVNPKG